MRVTPAVLTEALESSQFKPFILIDIEIDSTHYRYTDCDIPLTYEDNVYSPHPFNVENVRHSLQRIVNSFQLNIESMKSALATAFVGGTPQGSDVTLYLVCIPDCPLDGVTYDDIAITGDADDTPETVAGLFFGPDNEDDSWRLRVDEEDMMIECRESDVWNEYGRFEGPEES